MRSLLGELHVSSSRGNIQLWLDPVCCCHGIIVLFLFDAFLFLSTDLVILSEPLKGLREQFAQVGISSDDI